MSKICRTCLQRTNETLKATQILGNFGDGSLRIAAVLRFCIPELYLGLSSNPQICVICLESLKASYLFKKRCLDTENMIGDFLKHARSTGKSVDLHDVLKYFKDKEESLPINLPNEDGSCKEVESNTPQSISFSVHNIINTVPEGEVTSQEQILDVRQSAPNPTNHGRLIDLSNSHGIFIRQHMPAFQYQTTTSGTNQENIISFSNPPNLVFKQGVVNKILKVFEQPIIDNSQNSVQTNDVFKSVVNVTDTLTSLNDTPQNTDNCEEFCKISSVFSLNDDADEENKKDDEIANTDNTDNVSEQNMAEEDTVDVEDAMDIKDEPLDIDSSEEQNLTNIQTDEETLDASETASYENRCKSELQDFINSIPEVDHPDQYVDIPDFVTINNFGFKELEQLRLQQQAEGQGQVEKSNNEDTLVNAPKSELKVVKLLSSLPNVIILNGKRMVKCGNGYKVSEDQSNLLGGDEKRFTSSAVQTITDAFSSVRKRNKRKLKIVPVGGEPPTKKWKLKLPENAKSVKTEEIVVLFTSYTSDGFYINDHDYLISPYKRNKILIEEGSKWMCMCYICNLKHHVHNHLEHMRTHGVCCSICQKDQGTPFMHNIHVRAHKKPCRYCSQIVPYSLLKSHEEEHFPIKGPEELKTSTVRRGRKKRTQVEPVHLQLPKQDEDCTDKSDGSQSETMLSPVIIENKFETENSHSEDLDTSKKRGRGRPRRKPSEESIREIIEKPRTLRTRVKKWYAESDDEEDCVKVEGSSSSEGVTSEVKDSEK